MSLKRLLYLMGVVGGGIFSADNLTLYTIVWVHINDSLVSVSSFKSA